VEYKNVDSFERALRTFDYEAVLGPKVSILFNLCKYSVNNLIIHHCLSLSLDKTSNLTHKLFYRLYVLET
jgi:hypothetical protein